MEDDDVPIIAFFGTKGGVGKTTISSRFAEYVTYGPGNPNVLMLDFDVQQRGMTINFTSGLGFSSNTIHEYMTEKLEIFDEAIDVTHKKNRQIGGRLYLIPASQTDSKFVYSDTAKMNYGDLVNKIIDLIKWAIGKYNISCIVIDCGPIIDPYTAAAAHIADRAFIIGQNEPISYQSLKNYTNKISEFYDEFKSSKMGIIINKVRAADRVPPDVFLSIPFTMEVIDISEGIEDINQIRLSLFNSYIQQIIYEVFQNNKMLIPPKEVALNSELRDLEKDIDKLYKHKEIKFFKHSKISSILFMSIIILGIGFKFYYAKINPFSIHGMNLNSSLNSSLNQALIRDPNMLFNLVIILGIIGFFISYIISKRYSDNLFIINNIKDGGADYIASMLQSKDGRAKLEKIRTMMKRVQDKRIESNENQSAND